MEFIRKTNFNDVYDVVRVLLFYLHQLHWVYTAHEKFIGKPNDSFDIGMYLFCTESNIFIEIKFTFSIVLKPYFSSVLFVLHLLGYIN